MTTIYKYIVFFTIPGEARKTKESLETFETPRQANGAANVFRRKRELLDGATEISTYIKAIEKKYE